MKAGSATLLTHVLLPLLVVANVADKLVAWRRRREDARGGLTREHPTHCTHWHGQAPLLAGPVAYRCCICRHTNPSQPPAILSQSERRP